MQPVTAAVSVDRRDRLQAVLVDPAEHEPALAIATAIVHSGGGMLGFDIAQTQQIAGLRIEHREPAFQSQKQPFSVIQKGETADPFRHLHLFERVPIHVATPERAAVNIGPEQPLNDRMPLNPFGQGVAAVDQQGGGNLISQGRGLLHSG